MNGTFGFLIASIVLLTPSPTQRTGGIEPFSSIELPGGGHVALRPAATHSVTLVRGSPDYTRVSVADGGRLVIDKCFRKCPRGYRLEVEISAPTVSSISLANGGRIQSLGNFPGQGELVLAVAHGGTVDARSMPAQRVIASVNQGGRILTVPRVSLDASVTQGGAITYWGDAQVTSSIRHGGVVTRGNAGEVNLPLSEVSP